MARRLLRLCGACALISSRVRAVWLESPEAYPESANQAEAHQEYRLSHHMDEAVDKPSLFTAALCKEKPFMCAAPFNCHTRDKQVKTYATADGHADPSEWCSLKKTPFQGPVLSCMNGFLTSYAAGMFQAQTLYRQYDALYCFSYGHCDNTDVTPQTTLAEAEAICDRHVGHDVWTGIKKPDLNPFEKMNEQFGLWKNRTWVTSFLTELSFQDVAAVSCAMGTFHCDVVYCQKAYCGNPQWREQFDAFRPEALRKLHGSNYAPMAPDWKEITKEVYGNASWVENLTSWPSVYRAKKLQGKRTNLDALQTLFETSRKFQKDFKDKQNMTNLDALMHFARALAGLPTKNSTKGLDAGLLAVAEEMLKWPVVLQEKKLGKKPTKEAKILDFFESSIYEIQAWVREEKARIEVGTSTQIDFVAKLGEKIGALLLNDELVKPLMGA